MREQIVFLVDADLPSYVEAADWYRQAFEAAGLRVEQRPYTPWEQRWTGDEWVVHHTIAPRLRRVPDVHNTAVLFHEWDRFPPAWVATLDTFDSVWAPSAHVASTLRASGVRAPVALVPPPAAARLDVPAKRSWTIGAPARFLSVGQAHFRKGFHLLLEGFMRAFPATGEATLTLKVQEGCTWTTPRSDIIVMAQRMDRRSMMALYARHDAYVSASLGEGLGLPVAEAVMAGVPVIVNQWGGHRDLAQPGDCWPIAHDVVPQLFCSDPAYYAPGQRCAYSAPGQVAAALRACCEASAAERERRARRARAALESTHGLAAVAALVSRQHAAVHARQEALSR